MPKKIALKTPQSLPEIKPKKVAATQPFPAHCKTLKVYLTQ